MPRLCGKFSGPVFQRFAFDGLTVLSDLDPYSRIDLAGQHNIVGGFETFNGVMDEVAIWDEALTPDEVMAVYTLGPQALDPRNANAPEPKDEATDVSRDIVLSWEPGIYAAKHNLPWHEY